jgi:hypothetical protein
MGLHENSDLFAKHEILNKLSAAFDEAGWPLREHARAHGFGFTGGPGGGPFGHRGQGPRRDAGPEAERGEARQRRGGPGGRRRGPGGPGPDFWGGSGPEPVSAADVSGWLTGRLPDGWLTGPPQVTVDRDEIIIVGPLAAPDVPEGTAESDLPAATAAAEAGRISRFREETRDERIRIAREAEHRYGRKIAWGATAGGTTELFTTMSVPVMTRLRQPERSVLDTLVDAGVARSRSDALAWCVRLVGEHAEEWLGQLRDAMTAVERVRAEGPKL